MMESKGIGLQVLDRYDV